MLDPRDRDESSCRVQRPLLRAITVERPGLVVGRPSAAGHRRAKRSPQARRWQADRGQERDRPSSSFSREAPRLRPESRTRPKQSFRGTLDLHNLRDSDRRVLRAARPAVDPRPTYPPPGAGDPPSRTTMPQLPQTAEHGHVRWQAVRCGSWPSGGDPIQTGRRVAVRTARLVSHQVQSLAVATARSTALSPSAVGDRGQRQAPAPLTLRTLARRAAVRDGDAPRSSRGAVRRRSRPWRDRGARPRGCVQQARIVRGRQETGRRTTRPAGVRNQISQTSSGPRARRGRGG